jgi:hypothetical protein
MFRCLLNVGERQITIFIGDILNLVKAGQRVFDMRGIRQRLLALLGERKDAFRKIGLFRSTQLTKVVSS